MGTSPVEELCSAPPITTKPSQLKTMNAAAPAADAACKRAIEGSPQACATRY